MVAPREKRTKVVTTRLGESIVAELHALAEADRRKLGNYIAMVLEDHVAAVRAARKARGEGGKGKGGS
jgi:hypothetical protein